MLLFNSFSNDAQWKKKYTDREVSVDTRWKKVLRDEYRDSSITEGTCGAYLIQNIAKFKKLWSAECKKKKSSGHLGDNYDHLYLVPMNVPGIDMLRTVMLTPEKEHREREIERALSRGFAESIGRRFERNEGEYADIFPLKLEWDGEWFYFTEGSWLDMTKVWDIREILKADDSIGAGIICEPWQHEYYKTIFPVMATYWPGKTEEEIRSDDYGVVEQDPEESEANGREYIAEEFGDDDYEEEYREVRKPERVIDDIEAMFSDFD